MKGDNDCKNKVEDVFKKQWLVSFQKTWIRSRI